MNLKVRRIKSKTQIKAGRPKKSKNKATIEANRFLRSRSQSILEKSWQQAKEGTTVLMKVFLDKVIPYSVESYMKISLPKLDNNKDAKRFAKKVLKKVSRGEYSLESGEKFAGLIERFIGIISYEDMENRIKELEKRIK